LNCLEFWNIKIFIKYTFAIMCFNHNSSADFFHVLTTSASRWETANTTFPEGKSFIWCWIESYSPISKFWGWQIM
jgi:hypothetical protein